MYMTGLSIGVHLLNLLCLPAIVLVYYYRKFPQRIPRQDLYGSLIALGISVVILAAVLYGVVPGIVQVGGWFELLFVNVLGCPFNTGEIIYIFLLIAITIWAIYETHRDVSQKKQNIAFLLSVAMLGIPFYIMDGQRSSSASWYLPFYGLCSSTRREKTCWSLPASRTRHCSVC